MNRLPLLLSVLLVVATLHSPALAQTVHAVPFGSSGNAIELELEPLTGDISLPDGIEVLVADAPAWLRAHASVAVPDSSGVARLVFDVERSAPVGNAFEVSFEVRASGAVVARHEVHLEVAPPSEAALLPPYPNPTQGGATVAYELPSAGPVRLSVYDVLGREVAVLAEDDVEAGAHESQVSTAGLAAGTYLIRLATEGTALVRRLTVVR